MNLDNEMLKASMAAYNRDEFAAQIGTVFEIRFSDLNVEAKLVEVTPLKSFPRQESFSLYFWFQKDKAPTDGSYLMEHPVIGAREIFISPVESDADGVIYEAVFNRLLPSAD